MSPTMKVGLVLAAVGVYFVLQVVDKLRLPSAHRMRRRRALRRAKAGRS